MWVNRINGGIYILARTCLAQFIRHHLLEELGGHVVMRKYTQKHARDFISCFAHLAERTSNREGLIRYSRVREKKRTNE